MFSTGKTLPKKLYLLGVIVIFAAVYSQYFISIKGALGFLVVYGIPIAVTSLFFGRELLQRAGKNNKTAFKLGLGLFGALTVVGIFLSIIALAIILRFDQQVANLLNKPNPVLDVPQDVAWIMVAVSILVVGPAEEYLFRGFLYGGLLNISKGKHWLPLAVASSLLFAIVHGYYAVTYGAASVIPFITLVTFSSAMAVTYYWSGGNILVPAVIHGVYDAIGFLGVATTTDISLALRLAFIAIGVAFAVVYLPKKIRILRLTPETKPETAPPPPQPPQM
jgi:membrane protease YdiL (CAAX protease family)